jgi:hypothetical protein
LEGQLTSSHYRKSILKCKATEEPETRFLSWSLPNGTI